MVTHEKSSIFHDVAGNRGKVFKLFESANLSAKFVYICNRNQFGG